MHVVTQDSITTQLATLPRTIMLTFHGADWLRGRPGHHCLRRYRLEHERPRCNLGPLADADVAQHRGGRADQHVVGDFGVAVAALFARAAQRHVLWSNKMPVGSEQAQ